MANGSRTLSAMAMAATMCLAVAATPALAQSGLARLDAYNVDPSQVSVSGASGGGVMAIQLGVAYSSRIMGVAVFSAPPYDRMRVYSPARTPGHPEDDYCVGLFTPDLAPLLANMRAWSGRQIDPLDNLARQRIFIFEGTSDSVVGPSVVGQTVKQYAEFVPASNLHYEFSVPAGHVFPTDFDNPYSNSRSSFCIAVGFYMANCGYDGAGAELQWIYGPLKPRTPGLPDGNLLSVNQGEFVARRQGMDELAFLYVPKSCAAGARCRLHLFLHGCRASYFHLGDAFFANYSGHSRWAETNDIILLFPQTYPDDAVNPQGCWDTNGTYDDEFDQKGGGGRPRPSWPWSRGSRADIRDQPRPSSTAMPDSTITS